MFTTAHPRVATPRGGSAARTHGTAKRLAATVTAFALGGAFALVAPLSASAAEVPASYAEGQFLSGTLLGVDLDSTLSIRSAEASNDGTQPTQTSKDPLDAAVLEDAVVVDQAESPQVDLGGVLQVGPVAQYAEASSDGSSLGASGAVADDGAIGIGSDRSTPPANASLDLEALLGPEFAATVADLKLEIGAIAAQAVGDADTASGDYQISDAILSFTSPAIADLTPKVDSALQQVSDELSDLIGRNGDLVAGLDGLLVDLDPLLNLAGGDGNVTATIDAGDLQAIVNSILEDEYGDGAVSFDLETGEVHVDLAALVGGDINDLPPGTELLTDAVVDQILEGITSTVSTIADQVVDKVEDALHDATVDIHADLSTNVAQSPVVQQACRLVDRVLTTPVLGDVSALDQVLALANGLVGDLTDGLVDEVGDYVRDQNGTVRQITGFVNQTVQDTVCDTTSTPVAPLTTGLALDVTATVDQLLNGLAAQATAGAEVLGVPVDVDVSSMLDGLGGTLLDGLFDGDGAVQDLVDALQTGLVDPATEGLLGTGTGTVGDALRDILSIQVNVQELTAADGTVTTAHAGKFGRLVDAVLGGEFTETAMRVTVLGGDLSTLNLAQATVGPNVTAIVDPECTDPDGCDVGGETTTPPGGGGGGGSLAYTGIGIATLIAVILALLAAGAYLVRESYRRNHPVEIAG
jgi:hypothetical protein